MLRVALADLNRGAVETVGEIPAEDPLFAAYEDVKLAQPVKVQGRLSKAGEDTYYWRASFQTAARADCRRCLTSVEVPIVESIGLVIGAGQGASEEEGYYLLPERARDIDLREPLREEVLLALPLFLECRPDCRGLCPRCGANLNEGPCGCDPAGDPRWDALRAAVPPDPQTS